MAKTHTKHPAPVNRPPNLPIYQSTAWLFEDMDQAARVFAGEEPGVSYATLGGIPNNALLESTLRELHGAEDAVATCGGMAALAAVFSAHMETGARVVASRDLFGLTIALLREYERFGVETVYVDFDQPAELEDALDGGASMLLAETISNPLTRVPDLGRLAAAARRVGALLVVDNTFAGPYHCRALEAEVDLVMESMTKSLAGHDDAVLGGVAGRTELVAPIRRVLSRTSGFPAPFVAWLGQRGLASYDLRQRQASANALALARWLEGKDGVAEVFYPGLCSHPDHALARRYLRNGFGSVLSFRLDGGPERVRPFLDGLAATRLLMTLGGPATTISHPASMTHRTLEPARRRALGITDDLLRVAVGVEPAGVVADDFEKAFGA